MIRINLLPHREEKRKARQQQMLFISGGVAVLGALSVLLGYIAIAGLIDHQNGNNQYLQSEITKLNTEIEEIKALKDKTRSLLDRKKVVEDLQADRAEAVHLLDQMVRLLPEGIYLKGVKQNGKVVNIQGYAQSNARVSTLMRNLEASPWLETPDLVEIKAVTVNNLRANEFSLNIKISAPQKEAIPSAKQPKDKKS
ncbi:MAG: fimbrial protein [Betaproteobacteria bacterium RBG_16_58_11]|nr:MAG: fimbrial protein [Betaproteobacteria bacterium RBG_16_58_11]